MTLSLHDHLELHTTTLSTISVCAYIHNIHKYTCFPCLINLFSLHLFSKRLRDDGTGVAGTGSLLNPRSSHADGKMFILLLLMSSFFFLFNQHFLFISSICVFLFDFFPFACLYPQAFVNYSLLPLYRSFILLLT